VAAKQMNLHALTPHQLSPQLRECMSELDPFHGLQNAIGICHNCMKQLEKAAGETDMPLVSMFVYVNT